MRFELRVKSAISVMDVGRARHGAVFHMLEMLSLCGTSEVIRNKRHVGVRHIAECFRDAVGRVIVQETIWAGISERVR